MEVPPGAAAAPASAFSRLMPALSTARSAAGRGLVFVGAGALLSSAALAWARYKASKADQALPPEFVLELDLEQLKVVEALSPSPLALLRGEAANQVELRQVVRALERAQEDKRVHGLITVVGAREQLGGLASVQELRQAILRFKEAARGRATTAAFASAFGEAGMSGMAPFMLAAASERVYMQPSGMLGLTGLENRQVFVRGLLDKLRVVPHFFAREEYKSFANMFTERGLTPAHRENVTVLVNDLSSQLLDAIASSRSLSTEQAVAAVDAAPLLPQDALEAKLLDGTKYREEVQELFPISDAALAKEKARLGKRHRRRADDRRLPRVPIQKYIMVSEMQEAARRSSEQGMLSGTPFEGLQLMWQGRLQASVDAAVQNKSPPPPPGPGRKPKIAVVTAVGSIVQGPVPPGPGNTQQVIDASKLRRQLGALLDDDDVKAVVLRVSSPGGSALASDTLHHELMRLRGAGKKVVVSMGDVAASGGYYIASAADKIVAQPGTVTGSIGVVIGKVDVAGALQEVGVNTEAVKVGANADLLSPFTGLSPQQEAKVQAAMDHVYKDFLTKVSAFTGKGLEEVRALAKGRVYTGAEAQRLGLVDELGGLQKAIEVARSLAGLPADKDKSLVVEHPPRRVPLLLQLIRRSGMVDEATGGEGGGAAAAAGEGLVGEAVAWLSRSVSAAAAGGVGVSGGGLTQALARLVAGGSGVDAELARLAAQLSQLDGEIRMYSFEAEALSKL